MDPYISSLKFLPFELDVSLRVPNSKKEMISGIATQPMCDIEI